MNKIKQYLPIILCLLVLGAGVAYDHAPSLSDLSLPDFLSGFSSGSKAPAAWVVIVRDESLQTHAQTEAWDAAAPRKLMLDAKVQFRLLDPKQRESMPQAFWPWLERAAQVKDSAASGAIIMSDAAGKILDAEKAPQTEQDFLAVLKKKGKL